MPPVQINNPMVPDYAAWPCIGKIKNGKAQGGLTWHLFV
jgi:hypothetical protein